MGRLAEQQRKLLEQMMGPEAMGVNPIQADWWDPKVCRNYLCGTCPHDVFGNTKMDLGPCPRIHNDKIVQAYKEAKLKNPLDPRFAAFEQEYQNNIYAFIEDCDRKIRMSQRRLEKTPEENKRTVDLMKEVGEIELAIQGVTEEIEQLGEAGKVEESMAKLQAVEALKQEKEDKEAELQRLTETGGASGHQKLRVCETCGAYLSVLDSDRRLADHFGGKMHLGYHELRQKLEEFNAQRQAARSGLGNRGPGGGMGMGPGGSRQNGYGGANATPTNAPSGPSSRGLAPPPQQQQQQQQQQPSTTPSASSSFGHAPPPPGPSTPSRHTASAAMQVGVENEMDGGALLPGHGDKRKREAQELLEDARSTRDRGEEDRDRKRYRSKERDGHRDRDREGKDSRDREREHGRDRESHRDSNRDRYRDDDRERRRHRDDRTDRDRDYRRDSRDRDAGRTSRHERNRDEEAR